MAMILVCRPPDATEPYSSWRRVRQQGFYTQSLRYRLPCFATQTFAGKLSSNPESLASFNAVT